MVDQGWMPDPIKVDMKPLNIPPPLKISYPHISRTDPSKATSEIHDVDDNKSESNSRATTDIGDDGEVGESSFD